MDFYHVTLKENWSKIQEEGLIPKIGKLSNKLGESTEAIYLFNSIEEMDNALLNWLGEELDEEFGENCPIVCLRITLPADYFEHDRNFYESVCEKSIPSQYIEIIREE